MAIVKVKSIRSIENFCAYLISKSKHKGQEIITINNFQKNIDKVFSDIAVYKQGRRGHKPKPLSYLLSYPKGTSREEIISRFKETLKEFYMFINEDEQLELTEEQIEKQVNNLVAVIHLKSSNPHVHFLVPRVIFSNKLNKLVYIDISKLKYLNKLKSLNGWKVKDYIQNKKIKSLYDFREEKRLEELEIMKEQLKQFKELGGKIYELCLKDLKKGHTQKASKKLEKLKKYQKKMEKKYE